MSMVLFLLLAALCPACPRTAAVIPSTASARNPETLSADETRAFLLNAKVVKVKDAPKGITGVKRLTLSDGKLTHDASFQPIDESKPKWDSNTGQSELNFRDSYKFNIAAFELSKLLGLGDMMPETVERKWQGKKGSLSWWLPVMMDEEQRLKKKIRAPDPEAWNRQMYKMRVFSQLVYDTDRNLGNVLISESWHLWMIDFTRAFRAHHTLQEPKDLVKCDRQLLEKLRRLTVSEVEQVTKKWLTSLEIKGLMARREKIVALFDKLVAEKGENEVLYD
jgi:hypothetical protein